MNKPLLIHIGMPKCASTWLQRKLFTKQFGFYNIEQVESSDLSRADLLKLILPEESPYFNKVACIDQFNKHLIQPSEDNNCIPVFSHERLVGTQYFGSYDRTMIAQRLHTSFPDAKILIVIREQKNLIQSHYRQIIKGGGSLTLKQYLNQEWKGPYMPKFNLIQFDFHKLVSFYQDLFGKDKVLFLPYELFKTEPEYFVTQILQHCDSELLSPSPDWSDRVNPSPSVSNTFLRRSLNKVVFTQRNVLNPNALFYTQKASNVWPLLQLSKSMENRIKKKHTDIISQSVGNFYVESNRQLQLLTNHNLMDLGYDLGGKNMITDIS